MGLVKDKRFPPAGSPFQVIPARWCLSLLFAGALQLADAHRCNTHGRWLPSQPVCASAMVSRPFFLPQCQMDFPPEGETPAGMSPLSASLAPCGQGALACSCGDCPSGPDCTPVRAALRARLQTRAPSLPGQANAVTAAAHLAPAAASAAAGAAARVLDAAHRVADLYRPHAVPAVGGICGMHAGLCPGDCPPAAPGFEPGRQHAGGGGGRRRTSRRAVPASRRRRGSGRQRGCADGRWWPARGG